MIERNVSVGFGSNNTTKVRVSQFDSMWTFVFAVYMDGERWTIPNGLTVQMNGRKPDKNVFAFPGTIVNNTVKVDCDIQMTACAGQTICELVFLDANEKTVGTANFVLAVEPAPKSPDDVSSESTLPAYAAVLNAVTEDDESVRLAAASAAAAQAVLESIPSDYSTLQEDVDDLKSDLSQEVTDRTAADTAMAAEVATKANADGVAENLTSGQTEQLLSDKYAEDSVPYQFRTSGGTADIGDREYDTLVGGTVAWNQIVPNAEKDFTSTDTDTRSSIQLMFRLNASPYTSFLTKNISNVGLYSYIVKATATGNAHIIHSGSLKNLTFVNGLPVINGHAYLLTMNFTGVDLSTVGGVVAKNIQLMDLTQMFGSTIADYIYSLETATEGAGVALFRSLFPNDYYEYDAGTLKSVEGLSAHETVGFNQWDEEWELGGIANADGAKYTDNARIRSKNYIPVFPSTTYYFKMPSALSQFKLAFYDADKTFISYTTKRNETFVTPANCHYMMIAENATDYGTTYKNDICINLSWSGYRNGEYEPYWKRSYPLDSTLTLRGIPKLDSSNHLYYDGDTYEADGTVTRKYGIVDLGTLNWSYSSERQWFNVNTGQIFIKPPAYNTDVANVICSKYVTVSNTYMRDTSPTAIGCSVNNGGYFIVRDTAYTDPAVFKTAMSGVYLVYELATPTTEEADPFASPQICDDFGTEEYVTTSIVPVGHNTKYPENLRAKIEGLPWDFSTLIAPTEKTNTATRNYTSGSLLIMKNVLYKVTANIANGGTITPGTNVTATTLSEVILALA